MISREIARTMSTESLVEELNFLDQAFNEMPGYTVPFVEGAYLALELKTRGITRKGTSIAQIIRNVEKAGSGRY